MALSFTPTDALNYAKRFESSAPLNDSDLKLRILNSASNKIHLFAPWSWSVAEHTQFDVVNGQIDYTVTDNSATLLYLIKSQYQESDGNVKDLKIVHSIPSNLKGSGNIKNIALTSSTNMRVHPIPKYSSSDLPRVFSWYKKRNTIVTDGNISTAATLLFPDEWFWVYEELVLLYAMRWADSNSNRVGDTLVQGGNARYNGQFGVAMDALNFMVLKETMFNMNLGEVVNG